MSGITAQLVASDTSTRRVSSSGSTAAGKMERAAPAIPMEPPSRYRGVPPRAGAHDPAVGGTRGNERVER